MRSAFSRFPRFLVACSSSSSRATLTFGTALLLAAATTGCEAYDLGDEKAPALAVNTANPAWNNGVQEILARRCDNCHAKEARPFAPGNVAPYKAGFSTNEAAFKKTWASASLAAINDPKDPMPPEYADPLTADEKKALETYLKKTIAAANPLAECKTTTTSLTYRNEEDSEKAIEPLVAVCQACHTGAAPYGGGVALDQVEQWKAQRVDAFEYLTGKRAKYMPDDDGAYAKGPSGQKVIEWLCGAEELK